MDDTAKSRTKWRLATAITAAVIIAGAILLIVWQRHHTADDAGLVSARVNSFYKKYQAPDGASVSERLRSEFLTEGFQRELAREEAASQENFEAAYAAGIGTCDPFTLAQDDIGSIQAINVHIKGDQADVIAAEKKDASYQIKLKLLKQNGEWLIDEIKPGRSEWARLKLLKRNREWLIDEIEPGRSDSSGVEMTPSNGSSPSSTATSSTAAQTPFKSSADFAIFALKLREQRVEARGGYNLTEDLTKNVPQESREDKEQAPAAGDAPIPTQEGKDRPHFDMDTHAHSLEIEGAKPQPQSEEKPTPKPSEPPKTTPTPPPAETPPPDQLALLRSTPPPPSSYRREEVQTRNLGNITNRGRSAVNAVGTPLGKYQKALYDAIGARFYFYASPQQQGHLINIGNVQIQFWVDRSGYVKNLKIVQNTSNETFANVCLRSVQEVQAPPIPKEIGDTLPSEGLFQEINFTMYGKNSATPSAAQPATSPGVQKTPGQH